MSVTIRRLLEERVDPTALGTARILVGMAAVVKGVDLWGLLWRLADPATLRLPALGPPLPLPGWAVVAVVGAFEVAALALVLGVRARVAAGALAGMIAGLVVLDLQLYANHFYLLGLVTGLLAVADPGAALGLESARRPRARVAAWPLLLLRAQLTLVYGFTLLAKLNVEFLSGEVLAASLRPGAPIPDGWRTPAVMGLLALGTVLLEGFLALGLWSPRLRAAAVGAGLGFHLAIVVLMGPLLALTAFGLEMAALYALFFQRPVSSPPAAA